MLHLILQMVSVTGRIDLKTARFEFNSLRSVPKIQLPDNLINEIDNIINKNNIYVWSIIRIKDKLLIDYYHPNIKRSSHAYTQFAFFIDIYLLILSFSSESFNQARALLIRISQPVCFPYHGLLAAEASGSRSSLADGCCWSRQRGIAGRCGRKGRVFPFWILRQFCHLGR